MKKRIKTFFIFSVAILMPISTINLVIGIIFAFSVIIPFYINHKLDNAKNNGQKDSS